MLLSLTYALPVVFVAQHGRVSGHDRDIFLNTDEHAELNSGKKSRPSWAWDTVGHMSFTHTCNVSGPWSEEALDVLQRFPIVNIERYMAQHQTCFTRHRQQWAGPDGCWLNTTHGNPACSTWTGPGGPGTAGPPWSWESAGLVGCSCDVEEAPIGLTPSATGLYVEDHLIAACKQLKERNQNLTTIFYTDSANMWTQDQISGWGRIGPQQMYWNPCVLRADNEIVSFHPEWLLRNSSGGQVWDHYANNHILDHSHEKAQQAWVDVCVNATRSGFVDGCFADFPDVGIGSGLQSAPMEPWNLTAEKARAWSAGHQKALATLDVALGDGILVANSKELGLVSGMMLETFTADEIPIIQAAAAKGIVNQVHTDMYGAKTADVRDALAAFLIGTGPLQYFSGPYGWQIAQTCDDPLGLEDVKRRWLPEFDKPLGKAHSLARHDSATNTSTRVFGVGTNVMYDHSANRGRIEWSDGSVTEGPGCAAEASTCKNCLPPLYEKGSTLKGTGGCSFKSDDAGAFTHPGGWHTAADMQRVRDNIASGKEPWKTAAKLFLSDTSLTSNYKPRPMAVVRRDTNWPPPHKANSSGDAEFSKDCLAAYYSMIKWAVTQDLTWATAAERIIDAWSANLQGFGGWDQMLAAGLYGGHLAQAAELLAHAKPDWPHKQRAKTMFQHVLHPVCAQICGRDSDGPPMPKPQSCSMGHGANGNWDAVCMDGISSWAVFTDNHTMMNQVTTYYQSGVGNGRLTNYIMPSGQCQESGRDQGHSMMGEEHLIATALTVWHATKTELFSLHDFRLRTGFEYAARYNLGHDIPFTPNCDVWNVSCFTKISAIGRGEFSPTWELVGAVYGAEATYTQQLLSAQTPGNWTGRTFRPCGQNWSSAPGRKPCTGFEEMYRPEGGKANSLMNPQGGHCCDGPPGLGTLLYFGMPQPHFKT